MIIPPGFLCPNSTGERRRWSISGSLRSDRTAFAVILLAAVVIRCAQYGNPVVQIDEQFYLLVGDRMLHGELPYIQFWDRKPFGLFAVYAAIRLLGGDGILIYQLIATLVAATTAFVVYRIARRGAGATGAVISAFVYLCYLSVNGGDGGQTPVFYNLLVATAGLLIVQSIEPADTRLPVIARQAAAIALLGLALQIKYTVVFEGAYFGLCALIIQYLRKTRISTIALFSIAFALLATLPTLLVGLLYCHLGYFHEFWFANFQSILLRPGADWATTGGRLFLIVLRLLPVAVPAALAARHWRRLGLGGIFVCGWCVASVLALLMFGTYFDHYALPLVLPLAIAGAPAYDDLKRGLRLGRRTIPIGALVLAAGAIYLAVNTANLRRYRGDGSTARRIAAIIRPGANHCAFVFAGDPILYYLSGACTATAYNFTTLLSERGDSGTLGIDPIAELRRTLDTHPGYIVIYTPPPRRVAYAATWNMVWEELRRNYVLLDSEKLAKRTDLVFVRRDLSVPNPPRRSAPTASVRAR